MIRFAYTFIISILLTQASIAQEIKPVYFEATNDSLVRFYYDENYYLIDKNSEFKSIERVSKLITKNAKFDGPFKDFNNFGRLILEGHYSNGLKNGDFVAYHPNGEKKWETSYKNDSIVKDWKYYYPDGQPMLFLKLNEKNDLVFYEYWDNNGNKTITNGIGKYDIVLPIVGFTEHGYTEYAVSGKVQDGYPVGNWIYKFIEKHRKGFSYHPVFRQHFVDNKIVSEEIYQEFETISLDKNDFEWTPTSYFTRAEFFLGKDGTFDQHAGFNAYLGKKFIEKFNFYLINETDFLELVDNGLAISYKTRVYKNGIPNKAYEIALPKNVSRRLRNYLTQLLSEIPYYLPSYLDQKPIQDILTISFEVKKAGQKFSIEYVDIKREKGH